MQTEQVLLKTTDQIEKGDIGVLQTNTEEPMRLSTSYYLVYKDLMKLYYNKAKPAIQ